MATFDGNVEDFENRYAADRGVHAKFYLFPQQNEQKSASAGRPIFDDTEFVEIIAAGNSTNIIKRPAREQDRQRFARQYASFKAGNEDEVHGTPLHEVPWVTRSQVEELSYMRIRTLEQLAGLADSTCGQTIGLYELKRRAIAALESADSAAPITELTLENEELKRVAESQQEEINLLKNQMQELISALKSKDADEPEEAPTKGKK